MHPLHQALLKLLHPVLLLVHLASFDAIHLEKDRGGLERGGFVVGLAVRIAILLLWRQASGDSDTMATLPDTRLAWHMLPCTTHAFLLGTRCYAQHTLTRHTLSYLAHAARHTLPYSA